MGAESAARGPVRITVTGPHRTDVVSELCAVLDQPGTSLLNIEQTARDGRLHLTLLASLGGEPGRERPVLKEVLWKAHELGLHVDFDPQGDVARGHAEHPVWALTVLGNPVSAALLAELARAAQQTGFVVERIQPLSFAQLTSVELSLRGEAERALRARLVSLRAELKCDLALQRETLTRRNKRLIVMDMDSTLIQQEVIDEIAVALGVKDKVSAITERAMNGELDFDSSLRERVRLLRGTPVKTLASVLERIQLTPGAEQLVRVLKRLGYRTAVISGGFMEIVEPIRAQLGLDYAYANRLEVEDGLLTGEVSGTIVNRERKAELLESIAMRERIGLDQVIAVGDGANDLDMLHRAGLGIAFNAKRSVQDQADTALNQPSLASILYLLGIRDAEAIDLEKA